MTDEIKLQEIRDKAAAYAKAYAQREYLDEFKRSKLSILMKTFEPLYPTAAAQEREARAHPDYLALLEGLKAAVEESERLRWELKIAEMQFEAWRTRAANQRAEKSRYGA